MEKPEVNNETQNENNEITEKALESVSGGFTPVPIPFVIQPKALPIHLVRPPFTPIFLP